MEEDCKYQNPLKFKTWKLQEKTLSRVTSITHNLNITGEEMTLWEKNTYIQDAFPNLTGDESL
jgi:hypothetical protein